MHYVISVHDDAEGAKLYIAHVADSEKSYLLQVATLLQPISQDEFAKGLAVMVYSEPPSCSVFANDDFYWCVEWQPGLVVVKVTADHELYWVAVRSPIPNFGGREAESSDWDHFDEDAENPQYNLIFNAWDALFDPDDRETQGFIPADLQTRSRYDQVMAYLNDLQRQAESRMSGDRSDWIDAMSNYLARQCGAGQRIL